MQGCLQNFLVQTVKSYQLEYADIFFWKKKDSCVRSRFV